MAGTLLQSTMLPAAMAASIVTAQPPAADPLVTQYYLDPAQNAPLSNSQMTTLVRQKIKYVFVLFNENESFDHEYGSFPGANGIYSTGTEPRSAANTPGYYQHYRDTVTGRYSTVTPFLVGPEQNSTVLDSVDHSHTGLAKKLAVDASGVPTMSGFAQTEYTGKSGTTPSAASEAKGRQFANLVMSHIDCNTIPFFWQYASRFTLFDNIFATEDTPSTPNAIAMIAGQSGETQWVKHGSAGTTGPVSGTINGVTYFGTATTQGPPFVNDPQPYYGSEFDTTKANRQPTGPLEFYGTTNIASNATFASVLLTSMGTKINDILSHDKNPAVNLADVQNDVPFIANSGTAMTNWRWYQNGYGHEPTDGKQVATHYNFVAHHNGPQYFGYVANNPTQQAHEQGENDFFTDIATGNLPKAGGMFYIRGGYVNLQGLKTPIQNKSYPKPLTATNISTIQTAKAGDDDHPSYSDRQISEAMNARVINAIASNPALWAQSAIIITYDESDGFYDHVPPRILSYGPDGLPLARGIRVPLLLISPYSRTHVVSHAEGDHNAIIETINAIFNLPALSSLPDEAAALKAGNSADFNKFGPAGFQQNYLGPRDTNSSITDSLLSGFDPKRLQGTAPPLPASYVRIAADLVTSLPHYNGQGCMKIGITPEDQRRGLSNPPPEHFNTLPGTLPEFNIPTP